MEKYKVSVNGKVYEVVVEKVDDNYVPETNEVEVKQPVSAPSGDAAVMNSPIQGTVLKVLVKPGQAVKKGEPVVVIEAMKLENDIVAKMMELSMKYLLVKDKLLIMGHHSYL